MVYHLKLIKGLSYEGFYGKVCATKDKPDVYVEDKATADAAVATGHFCLLDDGAAIMTGHLDAQQLETFKVDDLKGLAEKLGIDVKGLKKAEIISAIVATEVHAPVDGGEDEQGEDGGEDDEGGQDDDEQGQPNFSKGGGEE